MVDADIPELVPAPKEVRGGEGSFALPERFRVVASEGRGVLEEILHKAGFEIGEGGYEVEGMIGDCEVPDGAGEEYYELSVKRGGASIRAPKRDGLIWGMQTLAGLLRAGEEVPELEVRDWPDMGNRGIFVEDKWGPDRMSREDWFTVVDRLARLKMNRLGIGLYGCWGSCRFEPGPHEKGWPTEFLMVPVPGYPELKSQKRLRWYSPGEGVWKDESYLPRIFAEDFLGDVVAHARERGVTVIPFVNSLGHNTMIPRLVPQIAAKDEERRSLGIGYCLSNPETRRFIERFYGSVVERYFPDGADFFHIQMDEVWADHPDPDDPLKRVEPWCRCPECRAREREENLQEYILWLVGMLVEKGVGRVVMWNDQLTRHMDALDESFVGQLKERGLQDRLILHWWWYSNEALNEKTRVAIGRELGLPGWVAPMTCYFNWQMYSPRMQNIELMLQMAHEEGGKGAVSYSVHDPGWTDHEMLEASYAWNLASTGKWEEQEKRWALGRFGAGGERYLEAVDRLRKAAATPALGRCYHYTYTYSREGISWPRSYPGEALDALAGMEGAEGQLVEAAENAGRIGGVFAGLAESRDGDDRAILDSLRGEAARIEGLADSFAALLAIRKAVEEEDTEREHVARCERARERLLDCMRLIEGCKPKWVVPATLQSLSALLAFLEQLRGDLEECIAGERSADRVRWRAAGDSENE